MSDSQPFRCEVPNCLSWTSRIPHVCTIHFIEGWGRLPEMPLPPTAEDIPDNPVADRMAKAREAKRLKAVNK